MVFRPQVSDDEGHQKRNLLKTLSRLEIFERRFHVSVEDGENDDVWVLDPAYPG